MVSFIVLVPFYEILVGNIYSNNCLVSLEQERCSHNIHPTTCFTALLCQAHFVEELLTLYGLLVLLLLVTLWKPSIGTIPQ